MIFLIQYNRERGSIVRLESFTDSDRIRAEDTRLALEIELSREAVDDEVVLLEAATEAAVRRTHRRYFEDLHELTSQTASFDPHLLHSR